MLLSQGRMTTQGIKWRTLMWMTSQHFKNLFNCQHRNWIVISSIVNTANRHWIVVRQFSSTWNYVVKEGGLCNSFEGRGVTFHLRSINFKRHLKNSNTFTLVFWSRPIELQMFFGSSIVTCYTFTESLIQIFLWFTNFSKWRQQNGIHLEDLKGQEERKENQLTSNYWHQPKGGYIYEKEV